MKTRIVQSLAALIAAAVCAVPALAGSVTRYRLFDHPDGAQNPPPYGIRLDGLFDGTSTTTFSFDTAEGVIMTVIDNSDMGGGITINIAGVVYGGIDIGSEADPNHAGTGSYALDFTYSLNVVAEGTGYVVNPPAVGNGGTLNALNINGEEANFQFNIFEELGTGNPFKFLQDEHRLTGFPEAGQDFWVGRGWLSFANGQPTAGTQDFLFLATMIPLPTPWAMAGVGMLGLAASRRRRNRAL